MGIGYVRPVQFLDHLTVIIIVTNVHKLKTWASSQSELAYHFKFHIKIVVLCTIGSKNASEKGQTDSCFKSDLTV